MVRKSAQCAGLLKTRLPSLTESSNVESRTIVRKCKENDTFRISLGNPKDKVERLSNTVLEGYPGYHYLQYSGSFLGSTTLLNSRTYILSLSLVWIHVYCSFFSLRRVDRPWDEPLFGMEGWEGRVSIISDPRVVRKPKGNRTGPLPRQFV